MNEKKQFLQNSTNTVTPPVFWGTIALVVLFLLLNSYGITVLFVSDTSMIALAGQILLGLNCAALVISFVLIIRGRQNRAFGLVFSSGLALGLETVFLIQGRAFPVTVALPVVALVSFYWLCPPHLKRGLMIATASSLALVWIIELLDPAWRIVSSATQVAPIAATLFGVVFAIILFFQTTKTSIRARLIYGFLMMTIIPLVVTAVFNDNSTRAALTEDANQALLSAASQAAAQVDAFVASRLNITRYEAQLPIVVDYILLPESQRSGSPEESRLNKFIYARLSEDPVYINSVAVYDINGITLADTDTGEISVNKSNRSWFQNAVATGLPYASDMEFSRATGGPSLYFSAPVRDASGRIIGVIRTRYDAAILQRILSSEVKLAGQSSFPVLIDRESHMRLAHGTTPSLVFKTIVPQDPTTVEVLQSRQLLPPGTPEEISTNLPGFESALLAYETQPYFTAQLAASDNTGNQQGAVVETQHQKWLVVYAVAQDEFNAPINAQARNSILLTLLAGVSVAAFAVFIAQSLAGPISRLTQTAEAIAGGDINIQARVETGDEIGALASTFNRMTQQLRDFINTLEVRVAERTLNLELAAEVGRTVSQVRALDVMLTEAAELIRTQFDLYYVQVYLVNSSQTYLNLQAGTGQVGKELLGRNHRLPLNTDSINGRAAVEKKSVVISDTQSSAIFKPNPLLPNTRSEMAVPLMIGDRVVGVLDMQSEQSGSLDDVLTAFEAMAGQLAIAIQNANFLAETQQARAEVEAQSKRLSRSNWADYLDAIHKPEETGFVFEQNKVLPLVEDTEVKDNALVVPFSITGEELGNLVVELEGQSPIARTDDLLNTVARQVSQQIENLRLLDSAERYRLEAEEASRRLTREGWKSYIEEAGDKLSYVYDLKEVRLQNTSGDEMAETTGYALPLKVRDETIGKLVVQGLDMKDEDAVSIANAVAERLGTHLESLRQFEETQRGQMELDKRARQLAAVAEVSSVSSRELDIQKMLESVVFLTQRKFGLYHAHVFTYNSQTEILKITACGWKEGDEHEGTHGTTAIPLDQEQSLVARAARTQQAVIVNDVHNEPGWLPNPLLPDSAAELAVPLLIGNKILGVLDVQADHVDAFTEEDASIYSTLAAQIATALQNAQSFAQAQQQADRESKLNVISQKIQSATTVEAVLQIAARELGHTLGAPLTIAQLGLKESASDN